MIWDMNDEWNIRGNTLETWFGWMPWPHVAFRHWNDENSNGGISGSSFRVISWSGKPCGLLIFIYIYRDMYTYIDIYIYRHVYIYWHICIYIYIYIIIIIMNIHTCMYAYNYIYSVFPIPSNFKPSQPATATAPGVAGRRFRRGAGEKCHPAGSEKLPGSPVVEDGGGPEMQECKLIFGGKHPENVGWSVVYWWFLMILMRSWVSKLEF